MKGLYDIIVIKDFYNGKWFDFYKMINEYYIEFVWEGSSREREKREIFKLF